MNHNAHSNVTVTEVKDACAVNPRKVVFRRRTEMVNTCMS
jgi:hypothetical protein